MSIRLFKDVLASGVKPAPKRLVLLILAFRFNDETGQCNPSLQKIAEDCGISEKQARRWLRELEQEGIISSTGNPGSTLNRKIKLPTLPSEGVLPNKGDLSPELVEHSHARLVTPPVNGKAPLPQKGVKRDEEQKEERNIKRTASKPDDVSEKVWRDWLAHRAEGSMTESAITSFREEARKAGISLEKSLIEAMVRGWKCFKADWVQQSVRYIDTKQRTVAAIFDFPRSKEG